MVTTSSVKITVLDVYGTANNGAEEIAFYSCGDLKAADTEIVWKVGGCGNFGSVSTENPVVTLSDTEYTIESCAAACALHDWCTHFFLGIGENTNCIPIGPGCTQDSNAGWSYYKYARENTGAAGSAAPRRIELTAEAWNLDDLEGIRFEGEGEAYIPRGDWIESKETFTRPVTVTTPPAIGTLAGYCSEALKTS
jgi:hypothetical protein